MKKIVIVEDDLFMREELRSILQKEAYDISCLTDFGNTVEAIMKETPDLVVLDLNLPGITGFEVCKMLRQKHSVPILILTSRDQMKDELQALGLGADDYLTKPCHKDRLVMRVAALIRRNESMSQFMEWQGIRLDQKTYTMYTRGQSILLPENQGKIMEQLLAHANEIVTKEMLSTAVWKTTDYIDENALQVNMTRLKKNLAKVGLSNSILTVRGVGYCLKQSEERSND